MILYAPVPYADCFHQAVECILSEQQSVFVAELEMHVLKCVKDANGNHVCRNARHCRNRDYQLNPHEQRTGLAGRPFCKSIFNFKHRDKAAGVPVVSLFLYLTHVLAALGRHFMLQCRRDSSIVRT